MARKRSFVLASQQAEYVRLVTGGMRPRDAALKAGYSLSYAKKATQRLNQLPSVAKEVALIQAKGREAAAYTLATAMQEAQDAANFAKLHKNSMAYVKAVELRSKLSGLLIDRVQVEKIDITAALLEAQARVIDFPKLELPSPSGDPDSSEPHGNA